jgi:hypothetical protein
MRRRTRFSRRQRTLLGLLMATVALSALVGMALEARSLTVTHVTLEADDLPVALDGVTVAFVSDVHHGPYVSRERVVELVARVNALAPDVIVLGGDYVSRDRAYIGPVFAEFSRLRAPPGVYGVLGNHDHWEGAGETRRRMAEAGIDAIENEGVWLQRGDARLRLGGVGDLWEGDQSLAGALGGAAAEDFVLLVSHNPDYVESLPPQRVDLVLSGHTHGGQVTLFGQWAPIVPSDYGQKYRSGLVEGPTPVLVSNGIGAVTPPLRFFAPAEIVLLTLRTAARR